MDDLVSRFRAGDEEAVRAVYRRYSGAIATVARSILRSPELVEEVVQQTFLKAWRAAATFDPDRELAPWLYAIARRTAIDVHRRESRPTASDHEEEADVAVAAVSFDRTFEAYEVRRAIDSLPDAEREVVRLSHFVGMTHAEIAERLSIPIGTVKSRSGRAHRRLLSALGHLHPSANRTSADDVQASEDRT